MLSISTTVQNDQIVIPNDIPGIESLRTKSKIMVNGTVCTVTSKKKDPEGFRLTLNGIPTPEPVNAPEPEPHCEPGMSLFTISRKERNRLKKGTPIQTSAEDGNIEVKYPSRSRKNDQRQRATVKGGQIISLEGIAVAAR